MANDTSDIRSTLNGLIETLKDGEEGFRSSAQKLTNDEIRVQFQSLANQRACFALELQSEVTAIGGEPASSALICARVSFTGPLGAVAPEPLSWSNPTARSTATAAPPTAIEIRRGLIAAKRGRCRCLGASHPEGPAPRTRHALLHSRPGVLYPEACKSRVAPSDRRTVPPGRPLH